MKKSISAIKKAKKLNPKSQIYVTGCASQVHRNIFSKLKIIDKIIPNANKTDERLYKNYSINDLVEITQKKNFVFPVLRDKSKNRTRALLQIQQGCDHRCTFCIIPYGRGNAQSLPIKNILENVNKLLNWGYKEVTFTGIDITSYGNDLPGKPKLGNVIRRILDLQPKLQRVRFSSIDPAEIDEELFNLFCFEKKIMPHIHLSAQAGDNLILKRMKRRHTRENLISLCKQVKKLRPEITFGADIIVGFPTENNENFKNTLECIRECNFSNTHIFPFSAKFGTPASKMPQVSSKEKIQRVALARSLSNQIQKKFLEKKLLKPIKILFENEKISYSDDYFKVSVKNLSDKQKSNLKGEIISVSPIEVINDKVIGALI